MRTIGIDGCRAGWIAICLDEESAGYRLLESDAALEDIFEKCERIFIDIPIGLLDDRATRECDRLLREALGPDYHATVFNPPIRPALHAPTYAEASVESYEVTGKKISLQSWNIVPKIMAVDELLQNREPLREKVFESHPEFLFQRLNGGASIKQSKQTKKGLRHRLELLAEYSDYAEDLFRDIKEEYRRNQVDEDDIVDALALAVFARKSADEPVKTLPENPAKDSTGLPMAIHYV